MGDFKRFRSPLLSRGPRAVRPRNQLPCLAHCFSVALSTLATAAYGMSHPMRTRQRPFLRGRGPTPTLRWTLVGETHSDVGKAGKGKCPSHRWSRGCTTQSRTETSPGCPQRLPSGPCGTVTHLPDPFFSPTWASPMLPCTGTSIRVVQTWIGADAVGNLRSDLALASPQATAPMYASSSAL